MKIVLSIKFGHWNYFLYVHYDFRKVSEEKSAFKHTRIFSSLHAETNTSHLWLVEPVTQVLIEQQISSEREVSSFMFTVVWLNSKPCRGSISHTTPLSVFLQENLQPAFCGI